jgi:preprotein translocase subunit SecA
VFGLDKIIKSFNDPAEGTRKQYQARVDAINRLEPTIKALSDEQLQAKTAELKAQLAAGKTMDAILPEAFAVAREAAWRVLGLRPFDVQLIGGMILHEGKVAEMRTGEGKTLVSILPAYLNALTGNGVLVVTVNDYLARRDMELNSQVHRFLGLTVGLIQANMDPDRRKKAYGADITYVTNSEIGFDYLRDNLAVNLDELVQRGLSFCIVDEVDSILIDEARTPLIISGPAEAPSERYRKAAKLADALQKEVHYTVIEKSRTVKLTEEGYDTVEEILGVKDLFEPREQWATYIFNAIRAKELQVKNVNYIVSKGEIVIVDEFTGRTMPGRRWGDGLHQAIEAKEGIAVQNETVTIASVTYQSYFRSATKLGGMTGTANTEKGEFKDIYGLDVAVVPTNRPDIRQDSVDVVFATEAAKWKNVVREIRSYHRRGRPVLVGTTSVELSEKLSAMLTEANITHNVLNAKPQNVERESEIVAQSGRLRGVTISTNMAGRGTDILLGGNPEYMARLRIRSLLMPKVVGANEKYRLSPGLFPVELSEATAVLLEDAVDLASKDWGSLSELDAEDRVARACEKAPVNDAVLEELRRAYRAMVAEYKVETDKEKAEVLKLGGLHVIGTERHESRRIDNQLRGRAGRQGDPGSTRFFLSLEDNLFRIFGGDQMKGMMNMFQIEDQPIESQMLANALDNVQKKVESYFFDVRKNLFEYDQVLNTQRAAIYKSRANALKATSLENVYLDYAEKTMDDILEANVKPNVPLEVDLLDQLAAKLKQYCYLLTDVTGEVLLKESNGNYEGLRAYMRKRAVDAYNVKAEANRKVGERHSFEVQQFFLLSQTDRLWKDHLQAMKFLQTAIGLRGYAQRDPIIEYKFEGFELFKNMMAQLRRNCIYSFYMYNPK